MNRSSGPKARISLFMAFAALLAFTAAAWGSGPKLAVLPFEGGPGDGPAHLLRQGLMEHLTVLGARVTSLPSADTAGPWDAMVRGRVSTIHGVTRIVVYLVDGRTGRVVATEGRMWPGSPEARAALYRELAQALLRHLPREAPAGAAAPSPAVPAASASPGPPAPSGDPFADLLKEPPAPQEAPPAQETETPSATTDPFADLLKGEGPAAPPPGKTEPAPAPADPFSDLLKGLPREPAPAGKEAVPAAPEPLGDLLVPMPEAKPRSPLSGYIREEVAYRTSQPGQWSKIKTLAYVSFGKRLSDTVRIRVSGRAYYDAVFDVEETYPEAVEKDQETELELRDTYADLSLGNFDLRLGKQTVVWGEAVGLFFADVVNAKDLREFVLPEFDYIRTPQWALDLSYQLKDLRVEALWIPVLDFNRLGKPGAEYAYALPPLPEGTRVAVEDPVEPPSTFRNSDWGIRLSTLIRGWDLAAFYFDAWDRFPTYFRTVGVDPATGAVQVTFQPEHTRIRQIGATLSKALDPVVLRAEMVYTRDRYFATTDLATPRGVLRKDSLDYLLGLSYTPTRWLDTNVQFFQRIIFDHEPVLLEARAESYASLRLEGNFYDGRFKPEVLVFYGLRRTDYMARPRLVWYPGESWKLTLGYDAFGGEATGLFGQFKDRDRVYGEMQYNF